MSDRFSEDGISWLTGTVNWMYVAVAQYILGIRPTLDGLEVRPCLPKALKTVHIRRRFRGCLYEIELDNARRRSSKLTADGRLVKGNLLPLHPSGAGGIWGKIVAAAGQPAAHASILPAVSDLERSAHRIELDALPAVLSPEVDAKQTGTLHHPRPQAHKKETTDFRPGNGRIRLT